ncbi:hypothetical protein [Vulgatibacter sp.]|uniref:hypothetical protein n=1 Tax=Vulgatibacter sp. TaxID=1971226 RepID=UPI00356B0E42
MDRRLLTTLLALGTAGCSLPWADPGACAAPDPEAVAGQARHSIETRAFRAGATVDAAGRPFAARLPEGFGAGEAVVSWPDPGRFAGAPDELLALSTRSFVYDNALLALERTRSGDRAGAAALLATLAALQLPDGAWGFSFDLEGPFYDAGYVRAGTVAFAVYAFAKYASRFDDHRFRAFAGRGADWLLASRDPLTGLVLAGRGRWLESGRRFDGSYVADFVATEHQIDSYFALAALGGVDPDGPWSGGARAIEQAILRWLWDEEEGRFVQGHAASRGHDRGSALDAAGTWGALFHLAGGRLEEARRCLAWVERSHRSGGGLKPYADGPDTWFVEGSVAHALAWHRLAPAEGQAAASLQRIAALGCSTGLPLIYADRWAEDFPVAPAAAPTLWFVLAAEEIRGRGAPFLWSEGT